MTVEMTRSRTVSLLCTTGAVVVTALLCAVAAELICQDRTRRLTSVVAWVLAGVPGVVSYNPAAQDHLLTSVAPQVNRHSFENAVVAYSLRLLLLHLAVVSLAAWVVPSMYPAWARRMWRGGARFDLWMLVARRGCVPLLVCIGMLHATWAV